MLNIWQCNTTGYTLYILLVFLVVPVCRIHLEVSSTQSDMHLLVTMAVFQTHYTHSYGYTHTDSVSKYYWYSVDGQSFTTAQIGPIDTCVLCVVICARARNVSIITNMCVDTLSCRWVNTSLPTDVAIDVDCPTIKFFSAGTEDVFLYSQEACRSLGYVWPVIILCCMVSILSTHNMLLWFTTYNLSLLLAQSDNINSAL